MNKTILKHLTVTGYLEGIDLTDSQLLTKKLDDAKRTMQEAKNNVEIVKEELNQALKDSIKKIKKESDGNTGNYGARVTDFKTEFTKEKRALRNEYGKMIVKLERRESDIKMKLNKYKEKGHDKWESFKSELNHDLDGIEKTLKEFMVVNKKRVKKLVS